MLKWAVHNTNRQSAFSELIQPSPGQSIDTQDSIKPRETRRLSNTQSKVRVRRKSSRTEMTNMRRKIINRDKENNLTSTPLPLHRQSLSPLRRFASLRDLSNISSIPENIQSTPVQRPKPNTPHLSLANNNPLQYAATLPTFDAEYSPCSVVPGPILALRGMGIVDSYFDKPRYLTNDIPTIETKRIKTDLVAPITCDLQNFQFEIPQPKGVSTTKHPGEDSMSSSRMGDITLDRMIDAILESARKDRRIPKAKQQTCHTMSPTYTPAEDPASDLNEIWDPLCEKYRQSEDHRKRSEFNEREVRTPEGFNETLQNSVDQPSEILGSCNLRRQRAVRRKRKRTLSARNFIKSTVKSSTKKLFSNNSLLRKSFDELVEMDTPKEYSNLSTDSGRNSASDLEELSEDNNNCTRRRLSF